MIQLEGGKYVAYCDGGCGKSINTGQRSFRQAANYLSRAEEWDSVEHDGVWRNYCPDCVRGGLPDPDIDKIGVGFTQKRVWDDDD